MQIKKYTYTLQLRVMKSLFEEKYVYKFESILSLILKCERRSVIASILFTPIIVGKVVTQNYLISAINACTVKNFHFGSQTSMKW